MRSSGGVETYARLATWHEQSPRIFCRTTLERGFECLDLTVTVWCLFFFFFFPESYPRFVSGFAPIQSQTFLG